jgi:hypothetical protein
MNTDDNLFNDFLDLTRMIYQQMNRKFLLDTENLAWFIPKYITESANINKLYGITIYPNHSDSIVLCYLDVLPKGNEYKVEYFL